MSEILLINAKSWNAGLPSYLPYGVLWIAGILREKGFSVSILDRNVDKRDPVVVFLDEAPRIIGISCLTGPVIDDAIYLSKLARTFSPDSVIVWGGIHPTIFPRHVLKQRYVDYVIKGEGEFPLLELSQTVISGNKPIEAIANLGYKNGQDIILNPERDFIDLNSLPNPAWDLVDINSYIQKKFYSNRVITLNTSRGCPWACTFCYNQAVNRRRWRGMNAERIVSHMAYFEERHNIRGFQFYDDEFDVDEKRVVRMCELLLNNNKRYRFGHFSRVNNISLNKLMLEKNAGLRFIEFGVESGSDRMLAFIEKGQDTKTIRKAFDTCKKAKVKAGALFMLGLPEETGQGILETKKFIDSLHAYQAIPTVFKPYPATKLYDYCVDKGLFYLPQDLERQGEIYALGDFSINVSKTPSAVLRKTYFHFFVRNIVNELLNCIYRGNLILIGYYIKRRLSGVFANALRIRRKCAPVEK